MNARSFQALCALLLLAVVPMTALADSDDRRITVVGRGEANAVPDMATMRIGVETEAGAPSEAMAANAKRMTAVMARLEAAGIAAKDLQTSQLGVWPIYADRSKRNEPPEVTAYRASNQLSVTLRDIEKLGDILDQAVADGANSVNGPSFSVAEPEPHYQIARDEAVADAMAKAERYAEAAKVKLGKVISISETSSAPVLSRQVRAQSLEASTPVAAGESTFSASVTMVFAIEE